MFWPKWGGSPAIARHICPHGLWPHRASTTPRLYGASIDSASCGIDQIACVVSDLRNSRFAILTVVHDLATVANMKSTLETNRLYVPDIAALYGVKENTVRTWLCGARPWPEGLPKPKKLGGRVVWRRGDIERLFPKAEVAAVVRGRGR